MLLGKKSMIEKNTRKTWSFVFFLHSTEPPNILDLFKVIFYGFYHGKSPSFTTIWDNMLFTFSTHVFGKNPTKFVGFQPKDLMGNTTIFQKIP